MTTSKEPAIDLDDAHAAVERWGDTILRLALARLRDRADAEDAFQNTFLALVRTHPTFTSLAHQKAWLLRTACNCCNDIGRKRQRRVETTLEGIDVADPSSAPPQHDDLDAALDLLTEQQRTAVHLRYFEGYTAEEIARITGEKSATVRSHLFRARQALKIELTLGGKPSCTKSTLCANTAHDMSA